LVLDTDVLSSVNPEEQQGRRAGHACGAGNGRWQGNCNNPAFRTKRRVDLGLVCIHASKTLNKFFAK
jgi:hypothetical protein